MFWNFWSFSDATYEKSKNPRFGLPKKVSYDEVPDTICVVPTIQEAERYYEMEEIERGFGSFRDLKLNKEEINSRL